MSDKKRKLMIKILAITLVALMVCGVIGSAVYFMLL